MYLPEPMLDALRASTLPSLMTAWHLRLAELLGGFDAELAEEPVAPRPAPPSGEISPLAETLSGSRPVLSLEAMKDRARAAAKARAAAPRPSESRKRRKKRRPGAPRRGRGPTRRFSGRAR